MGCDTHPFALYFHDRFAATDMILNAVRDNQPISPQEAIERANVHTLTYFLTKDGMRIIEELVDAGKLFYTSDGRLITFSPDKLTKQTE